MMTHPFLSFRDNINSLFDDFHNDFFTDPRANSNMNMNEQQQQRRHRGGHDRRRLNYDNSDATRSELQPYNAGDWMNSWDQSTALHPASAIKLNIHEEKDKYVVQADVPGARKEDVHINIQDGYITISAERKECHTEGDPQLLKQQQQQQQKEKSSVNASDQQQQQKRRWVRREVSYGKVERSVALPRDVDQNAISARHEHGVLKITLPKAEQHSSEGTIAIE